MSDLKVPEPSLENDTVDCQQFWSTVEYEMLARGLCKGNVQQYESNCFKVSVIFTLHTGKNNPYTIDPEYTFWAPWIGVHTRSGNTVLNTEYRKCPSMKVTHHEPTDDDMALVSEDRLVDLLGNSSVWKHCLWSILQNI